MSGRSRGIVLAAVLGAALAAPIPVLELRAGGSPTILPLTGSAFAYTYRQSIYEVPVREELRVTGDAIRIDRVLSPDIRSLEYFRWPGKPSDGGSGMLAWNAPDDLTSVEQLRILVTAGGEQRIEAAGRAIDLYREFGDDASVVVRPARRPALLWLWSLRP